ncbi:MAG: hypothetical protein LQ338_002241 [Usnochroma carphineum]|nr:MAG: hypothetical protein LQ338_002241 [Usnochroma carphineum]
MANTMSHQYDTATDFDPDFEQWMVSFLAEQSAIVPLPQQPQIDATPPLPTPPVANDLTYERPQLQVQVAPTAASMPLINKHQQQQIRAPMAPHMPTPERLSRIPSFDSGYSSHTPSPTRWTPGPIGPGPYFQAPPPLAYPQPPAALPPVAGLSNAASERLMQYHPATFPVPAAAATTPYHQGPLLQPYGPASTLQPFDTLEPIPENLLDASTTIPDAWLDPATAAAAPFLQLHLPTPSQRPAVAAPAAQPAANNIGPVRTLPAKKRRGRPRKDDNPTGEIAFASITTPQDRCKEYAYLAPGGRAGFRGRKKVLVEWKDGEGDK